MFLNQDLSVVAKQRQDLLINLAMKQAFHIMQLPVLELSEWLSQEIESNPILEMDVHQEHMWESLDSMSAERGRIRSKAQELWDSQHLAQQESKWIGSISLYEHLSQQVPLYFEEPQEKHLAEMIIGHLNDKGFLDLPLQEVAPSIPEIFLEKILSRLQQMDPPGVAARDIRESFLLQLKIAAKEHTLGFKIIDQHFDLLLNNQIPRLARYLGLSPIEVQKVIEQELVPLDLYPGYRFSSPVITALIPDVFVYWIEGKWHVEVNTALLPKFRISSLYRKEVSDRSELSSYVRKHITAGRWLTRAVFKRNQTLSRIAAFVLKRQSAFFNGEGKGGLVALTTKEAAAELHLHESTVARAVAHKFIATPQGIFALRSLFKQGTESASGEKISSETLKKLLLKAIESEDKREPLSDEALSAQLHKQGVACARRTVSKYRSSLHIASALQRRRWSDV